MTTIVEAQNKNQTNQFTKNEKRTRKYWLLLTFCYFVLYPLSGLFEPSTEYPPNPATFLAPLVGAILGIIPLWMIWHCAYKKPGTKLLTFWLIVGPLRIIGSFWILQMDSWDLGIFSALLFVLGMYGLWYILSIKLIKMNKKFKVQKIEHPEYLESLNSIRSAHSLEDLDSKFAELIRKWPQYEPTSSKEYKSKSKELQKQNSVPDAPCAN